MLIPPRFQRGFTLLEVLVAMAVIAIALTAIIKTGGTATASTVYLKQKTYAHWVAMNRMSELQAEKNWPSVGSTSDTVELMGQEWEWTQKTTETVEPNLRRVEVSVVLADGGDEDYPLVKMVAFFLNPAVTGR
jgi:general secretion pathway protein I